MANLSSNIELLESVRVGIKVALFLDVFRQEQTSQREINKENDGMNLIKRLIKEDDGQGMVEYTLVVLLVALVFWVGVKGVDVGGHLAKGWVKVLDCVTSPFSCSA